MQPFLHYGIISFGHMTKVMTFIHYHMTNIYDILFFGDLAAIWDVEPGKPSRVSILRRIYPKDRKGDTKIWQIIRHTE